MTKPVMDPEYWRQRLEQSKIQGLPHQAIYNCTIDLWSEVERRHREILRDTVGDKESVLDVGCGYGRLLNLMPPTWTGEYVGVDVSPDFISLARGTYRHRVFLNVDVRELERLKLDRGHFNLAVMLSFRPMVRENLGEQVWAETERVIRYSARKLLYLEVNLEHGGSVE